MLRIRTQRIERVTIRCPIKEKEQAEAFCEAHGYNLVQLREEAPADNGRTFLIIADKDTTHEMTVDDYMEMVTGNAQPWDGDL
jgi:hypothetical protein